MSERLMITCAVCALLAGCAGETAGGEDGGMGSDPTADGGGAVGFDAGGPPPECDGAPPLELGRCRDAAGGEVCNGSEGQEPVFEAMPPDGSIAMVLGPQGATMFVMAARTVGIDPGDATVAYSRDNPLVEIRVTDEEGELMSFYRARSAFLEDPAAADAFYNASLFVIVDAHGGALSGATLHAEAVLRDSEGRVRGGSLAFVAGP